jgi:hypothetical protein
VTFFPRCSWRGGADSVPRLSHVVSTGPSRCEFLVAVGRGTLVMSMDDWFQGHEGRFRRASLAGRLRAATSLMST